MAPKVTSSRDRAGRKPAKPTTVTTSKGRANRSSVSQAKVTDGSNGKPPAAGARVTNASQRTSGGSARVTGGAKPSLPSGTRGGQVTSRGSAVTPPRPNGGPVRPVSVRDLGNNRPQMGGRGGASLPPGQRGASAPARPGGVPRLPGGGRPPIRLGGLRGGLLLAAGSAAADVVGRKAGEAIGGFMLDQTNQSRNDSRRNTPGGRSNPGRSSGKPATDGRYVPGSQQVPFKAPAAKPKPPTTSVSSGSRSSGVASSSRGSGGGSSSGRSSAPARPAARPASPPAASSAPKPPNLPKVEIETTDAPKADAPSKSSMKELMIRRPTGRDEMLQDNIRRARRKKSQ